MAASDAYKKMSACQIIFLVRFAAVITFLALCSCSTFAQTRFEIQPFFGYKFGGGTDVGQTP